MRNKLGVLVPNLGASQLAFSLLRSANALVRERSDWDVTVFYEDLRQPCVRPRFACMHVADAFSFDGHVVATTLTTAQKLLRLPACKSRAFYVWDLEWLRLERKAYAELAGVYRGFFQFLAARSQAHADAVTQAWNLPTRVVPDFDIPLLLEELLKDG